MSSVMVVLPAPLSPVRISLVNVCTGKAVLHSSNGWNSLMIGASLSEAHGGECDEDFSCRPSCFYSCLGTSHFNNYFRAWVQCISVNSVGWAANCDRGAAHSNSQHVRIHSNRAGQPNLRANETADHRDERLARERQHDRERRTNETPEQREERLTKRREQDRERRAIKLELKKHLSRRRRD